MIGLPARHNLHQAVHCRDVEHPTRANYAYHLLRVELDGNLNSVDVNAVQDQLHAAAGNLELTC